MENIFDHYDLLELQAWAVGTAVEGAEGEEEDLAGVTSMEAVVMEYMAATTTTMATGVGAVDLMANATFATRPATCGEIATDCLMDGPLLKAKRAEEQGEEEAEVVEAVRRLLAELGEEQQGPTPLYCDSQGAIALAKNPVLHGLTKHMKVKWHWVRSMVTAGEVELHYVKTTAQPADMMTKRLVEQQHWKCCKLAGMALN
ncbi:hypothetical protein CLOP_g7167 [Closterium sp. NIES-67]|nr:hypothetical protein CLOP_g7167 [Closterium sp. NIES-67]